MPLAVEPVEKYGVKLRVEGTTFFITGSIDTAKPGDFMTPFIKELNDGIVSEKLKSVTLNVTELEYLNSSGIREIVNWILMLEEIPENERYTIHIVYSSHYLWQESSISTFVFLNTDYVSKEVI